MKKTDAVRLTHHVARNVRRYQLKTAEAYSAQVGHFMDFCIDQKPAGTNEQKVSAWLSHCAPRIAASTQNQKLCAALFFFKDVLEKPLGDLGPWRYARRPQRAPVWLNPAETARLLDLMPGTWSLMGRVCYGSGLRLMELIRLRQQHVDLERRTLFILGGKGDKDRVVPLARACVAPLAEHIARVRSLWEGDAVAGYPPVHLPDGLERKYPNAGREWPWFWLWPARNLSTDPETRTIRRHHTDESGFQKAIKAAAARAGIGKRVKVHTLRHSFATHSLENGVAVTTLQKLLGHAHLETTSIYLHSLPHLVSSAPSPLDSLPGAVIPFPVSLATNKLKSI